MAFFDTIFIDKRKLKENLVYWQELVKKNNAQLNVVTKFCTSEKIILDFLMKNGVDKFCDSNLCNLVKLNLSTNIEKCSIKMRVSDVGLLHEAEEPCRLFVSSVAVLDALSEQKLEKSPKVVLIIECGDLKDGFYEQDIPEIIQKYKNLNIIGVSANFACLSGTMPSITILKTLKKIADFIAEERKLSASFVSVGGTVMHDLLLSGEAKNLVSEVRVGEGIFLGYNSSKGEAINALHSDVMTFEAEIIELQYKDIPATKEPCGLNALGEEKETRPCGKRLCAVLDFGVLVAKKTDLTCLASGASVVGQTFDFTVVDVTDCKESFFVGGSISFGVNYASASFAFMNRYVARSLK